MKSMRGLAAIISAGVIGAAAFFGGCARGEEYEKGKDDYFLANNFTSDTNGNQIADAGEYAGYGKNTFGSDEKICLGAIVHRMKGKEITASVLERTVSQKNKVTWKTIGEFTGIANEKTNERVWSFTYPLDSLSLKPGVYEVVWKEVGAVYDSEISRQKFEIKEMSAQKLHDEIGALMVEDLTGAVKENKRDFLDEQRQEHPERE